MAKWCATFGRWLALLALVLGCGEEDPVSSPLDRLRDLRIVAGNNQKGAPGLSLGQRLIVVAVDRRGRPVEGIEVRFEVVEGEGVLVDTTDIPGPLKIKITGADGRAGMRLALGSRPGINRVDATVIGLDGLPPTFTAIAEGEEAEGGPLPIPGRFPDAAHFSLAAETLNMPQNRFGLTNRITAFVFDDSSNVVGAGTVVRFRTTGGGIEGSDRTTAAGQATATLTMAEPLPADGWATVTAETEGRNKSVLAAQTHVVFSGASTILLERPGDFLVEPGELQTIRFFVGDANGHPLAAGTNIVVTAEGGTVRGQTDVVLPDAQGEEYTRFEVVFETAPEGDAPSMSIEVTSPNGNVQQTFRSAALAVGSERRSVALTLTVADSVLIADGASSTEIVALVEDDAGNGVPDEVVRFAADLGAIAATAITDAAGRARVEYLSAVNPEGVPAVRITARTGGLEDTTQVRLLGVELEIEAAEEKLAADGISRTEITARLTSENGDPVSSVPIDFGTAIGALSATRVTTGVTGRASVVYTSVASREDLADKVRGEGAGLVDEVDLVLLGVELVLVVEPDTIAADGNAQVLVAASLRRTDDVAIANGEMLFETTLGAVSPAVVETDGEGVARTILVAGTEEGKAEVTATYGGGLTERVSVILEKGPPASIVMVSVEPSAIGVRGSGSNETAIVTLEVRDARGNTVADGETILFRLDAPEGDEQVGPDSTTTVDGLVRAAVSSGTRARTVRLIAEAPLASGAVVISTPVPIAIHGGPPDQAHFSLASKPVNLAGRVLRGLESTITAFVFDKFSNPVPQGTSIQFQTDGGGVQGAAETNSDGQASVTLFTANPIPPEVNDFLARITGQTVDENGREITAFTHVLFSGPTDDIHLIGAGADSISSGNLFIPNDGDQLVFFTVSDISGLPLMGGSTIQVTSDVARISGDANILLPDVISGHTEFSIVVADPEPVEEPPRPPQRGSVLIRVESLNGNEQLTFGLTVD